MKRLGGIVAIAAFALLPLGGAHAAVFAGRDEYAVGPQDVIEGNLYVGSGGVSVGAQVEGDASLAGGSVSVTGRVSGDVMAVGGSVNLLGVVDGDLRAVGGQVLINGTVGGDTVVAGGMVHVLPGTVLEGDLYVAGGQVIIDGDILGSVSVRGGRVTINGTVGGNVDARVGESIMVGSGAVISGDIDYRSPKEIVFGQGAKVAGEVTYTPAGVRKIAAAKWQPGALALAVAGILTTMELLATLGLLALCIWQWRRSSLAVLQDASDKFLKSVGHGFVYAILVPIGIVLLLMSFVGTYVGGLLLLVYVAVMVLSNVFAGMLLGSMVSARINKKSSLDLTWKSAIGGVLLLRVFQIVPVFGWLLKVGLTLAVIGVLGDRAQKQLV